MREFTAYLICPVLALTGFRFSKEYRWGVSRFHRFVYAVCSTVAANYHADRLSGNRSTALKRIICDLRDNRI